MNPPEPPDTDNDARLEKVLEARRAPNTARAYQSAAAHFTRWREAADLDLDDRRSPVTWSGWRKRARPRRPSGWPLLPFEPRPAISVRTIRAVR